MFAFLGVKSCKSCLDLPRCVYLERWGLHLKPEPNRVFELPVEVVSHNDRTIGINGSSVVNFGAGADRGHDDHD